MLEYTFGIIASLFSMISFLPQVIHIYRKRSSQNISLGTYSLLTTASTIWFFYGHLIDNIPVMLTNFVIGCLCVSVIIAKLMFK
ncbi:MAG: hypothetical protein C0425_10065 [Chlorobiaceae bacterium]|nr:hypothetical protein [Chlorobiaceae bacterium]